MFFSAAGEEERSVLTVHAMHCDCAVTEGVIGDSSAPSRKCKQEPHLLEQSSSLLSLPSSTQVIYTHLSPSNEALCFNKTGLSELKVEFFY